MSSRAIIDTELKQILNLTLQQISTEINVPVSVLEYAYVPIFDALFYLRDSNENVDFLLQGGLNATTGLQGGSVQDTINYVKVLCVFIAMVAFIVILNDLSLLAVDVFVNPKDTIFNPLISTFTQPILQNLPEAIVPTARFFQEYISPLLFGKTTVGQLPVAYAPLRDIWPFIFSNMLAQNINIVYNSFYRFFHLSSNVKLFEDLGVIAALPAILVNLYNDVSNYELFLKNPNFHDLFIMILTIKFVIYFGRLSYEMFLIIYSKEIKYNTPLTNALIQRKAIEFSYEVQTFMLSYYLEIILEDQLISQNLGLSRQQSVFLATFLREIIFGTSKALSYVTIYPRFAVGTFLKKFFRQSLAIENAQWQVIFGSDIPNFDIQTLSQSSKFLTSFTKAILKKVESKRPLKEQDVFNTTQRVFAVRERLTSWIDLYEIGLEIVDEIVKEKTFQEYVKSQKNVLPGFTKYFTNKILPKLFGNITRFRAINYVYRFGEDAYNFNARYWNTVDRIFLDALATNFAFYLQEQSLKRITRKDKPIEIELKRSLSRKRTPSRERRNFIPERFPEVTFDSDLNIDELVKKAINSLGEFKFLGNVDQLAKNTTYLNTVKEHLQQIYVKFIDYFNRPAIENNIEEQNQERGPIIPIDQPKRGRSLLRK